MSKTIFINNGKKMVFTSGQSLTYGPMVKLKPLSPLNVSLTGMFDIYIYIEQRIENITWLSIFPANP
jgi:hypothetical protein